MRLSNKIFPPIFIVIAIFLLSLAFVVGAHQTFAANTYYFCDGNTNGVDSDPNNPANYFNDAGCSDPANVVPDFSVDEVTIVAGAEFDGDAVIRGSAENDGFINGNAAFYDNANNGDTGEVALDASFYDSSTNNDGVVDGNATFYGDDSSDGPFGSGRFITYGTVSGTSTRYFNSDATTTDDFTNPGPWTVVADGGVVDVTGAIYDNTTTFQTLNGGSFIYAGPIIPPTANFTYARTDGTTIDLNYDSSLATSSVPGTSDYSILVNGISDPISNVSITGTTTQDVVLTLSSPVSSDDIVILGYTPGSNPLTTAGGGDPVSALSNQEIIFAIPIATLPFATNNGNNNNSVFLNNKLYVAGTSTIGVIDTNTNTVVANISDSGGPVFLTNVGYKVYATNLNNTVSVINSNTETVLTTIPIHASIPSHYFHMAVVGNKIYVNGTSTIDVINTDTDTVVASIPDAGIPDSLSVVGIKLYASNFSTDDVSVINTNTNTIVATISMGGSPAYYSVSNGSKLYVGVDDNSQHLNQITKVIDTTTDTVIHTISIPISSGSPAPGTYYMIPVGNKVYVIDQIGQKISVVDSSSDTVVNTISGFSSNGVPFYLLRFGNKVYASASTRGLYVIDTDTESLLDSIAFNNIRHTDITLVGARIYATDNISNLVYVFNTPTVPSERPNLVSFTSTSANGTYSQGNTINITANFGWTLAPGSTMNVALNSGGSATLSTVSGSTLSGTYTVGSNDKTPDLDVSSITSASVTDTLGNHRTSYELPSSEAASGTLMVENSFITRNLGDVKNISIGSYVAIPTNANPYQISTPITIGGIQYSYVANQGSSTVSVIRLSDNSVVATIPVGLEPYGITVVNLSGTSYVYVTNIGSNTVSVINSGTNSVIATVNVGVGPYYTDHVGTNVYVTNGFSNTVSVIDANTNTVTATIPVGSYPHGIKAHGTDLYVANYGDQNYGAGNTISVINSLNNTVSATIIDPAGTDGPRGVTVLGSKVYVANFRSDNVSVIDTNTNTIIDTIAVGKGPRGIAGLGTHVYVENFDDGTISVIDTTNDTVVATIVAGHSPAGITVDGTNLYFTRFDDNEVSILDTTTNTLLGMSASATALGFTVQPSSTTTNSTITPAVTVSLLDSSGNPVTTATSSITLSIGTNPGSGTLSGSTTKQTVNGVATFNDLSINNAGTGYTLTASSSGLTGTTSTAFNITSAIPPATQLGFSQQPSSTTTNATISPAITVRVLDSTGTLVSTATSSITLSIGTNPGSGTLSGTLTRSAVSGVATFNDISINNAGTGYTLTASSSGLTATTSIAFNITNPAATKLGFNVQPSSTTTNTTITPPVTVRLLDTNGNLVSTATSSVTLLIGNNPASGTLSGSTTKQTVNGVATFNDISINNAGTGYTLTASSSGLTATTSTTFNISAPSSTQLGFNVQPSSTTTGSTITPAVTVRVLDASGNLVPTATSTVTISIGTNPGSGTLSGSTTISAISGVATFSNLSINNTGTGYTLIASSSGLTATTSTAFNITNPAATKLGFNIQPSNTVTNQTISPSVTVRLLDSNGNPVTTATTSVALLINNNPGSGTLSGSTTKTTINGVATFNDLSINNAGTGYTLTASSSGLTSTTSIAFNITNPAATQLGFSVQPSSTTTNTSIFPAITVRVLDSTGTLVSTATSSVTLSIGTNPGSGTLSGTLTRSAVSGVATFNDISINNAGTGYTLVASSSGLTGTTSTAFNITSSGGGNIPDTALAFSSEPSNTTAGINFSVSVEVLNASSSLDSNATSTITLSIGNNPSSGTLSGTNVVQAVNGVATFSNLSIDNAGTGYTLVAASGGLTGTTSTSFDIATASSGGGGGGGGGSYSAPTSGGGGGSSSSSSTSSSSSSTSCQPGDLYNTETGALCPASSPDAGCLSGNLFSTLTGNSCAVGVTTTTTITTPTTTINNSQLFTRDLTIGSIGDDVKALQVYLNTHGFPLVQAPGVIVNGVNSSASTGVGSLGNETTYFGSLTQTALAKFQAAHGIKPSVGYFGPLTRAYIANLRF